MDPALRFRVPAVALAAAVVMGGVLTGSGSAYSANTAVAVEDPPPSIVEDFAYPQAAQILAQYTVKLISGDGGILFVDCATPPVGDIGLISVYTTAPIGADGLGRLCFEVTKASGHIELEVPAVYEIRGDGRKTGTGHKTTAIVRTDAGQLPPVTVDPSGSTQVGVGTSGPPATLLQLVVTP